MKKIYTGIESSGKSLQLAREANNIVRRNARWFKKTGVLRPILTNSPFSDGFVQYAKDKGTEIVNWKNLSEIIFRDECDVFIDEILKYFDARNWQDLSLDAKHWLTQGAKSGVHVYGSAQDFSQVDKSFRLLCNEVYHVSKLIGSARPMKTRPSIGFIWGVCMMRRVNPSTYKGDTASMDSLGMPSFFPIVREDCEIFNTSLTIIPSEPAPLKKIVRVCPDDGYVRTRYV